MRESIAHIIVTYLVAGESATVFCVDNDLVFYVRKQLTDALREFKVEVTGVRGRCLDLSSGAVLQFGQLQEFAEGYTRTPIVVIVDGHRGNQVLVENARSLPCPFADGRAALYIEC